MGNRGTRAICLLRGYLLPAPARIRSWKSESEVLELTTVAVLLHVHQDEINRSLKGTPLKTHLEWKTETCLPRVTKTRSLLGFVAMQQGTNCESEFLPWHSMARLVLSLCACRATRRPTSFAAAGSRVWGLVASGYHCEIKRSIYNVL